MEGVSEVCKTKSGIGKVSSCWVFVLSSDTRKRIY